MADDAFLQQLAAEAADVQEIPSDEKIARLRAAAVEMVELSLDIDEREGQLNRDKERLWELRTRTLVSMMQDAGTDNLGLPGPGVDIVLANHTHANIKAEWPDEQREVGFAELDRVGGGDIVKNDVTFSFSRNQHVLVTCFLAVVDSAEFKNMVAETVRQADPKTNDTEVPDPTVRRAVPWNTLTAFVKEQVRRGTVLDLEKLGATVGQIVKIEKRKTE
jgi:hypothetical protein